MNVKAEYPINMNRYDGVTPEAIIRTINDMYSNLIVTTDVGQNQLWTTQYIDIDENKQALNFWRSWNHGLWISCCHRRKAWQHG